MVIVFLWIIANLIYEKSFRSKPYTIQQYTALKPGKYCNGKCGKLSQKTKTFHKIPIGFHLHLIYYKSCWKTSRPDCEWASSVLCLIPYQVATLPQDSSFLFHSRLNIFWRCVVGSVSDDNLTYYEWSIL